MYGSHILTNDYLITFETYISSEINELHFDLQHAGCSLLCIDL